MEVKTDIETKIEIDLTGKGMWIDLSGISVSIDPGSHLIEESSGLFYAMSPYWKMGGTW